MLSLRCFMWVRIEEIIISQISHRNERIEQFDNLWAIHKAIEYFVGILHNILINRPFS